MTANERIELFMGIRNYREKQVTIGLSLEEEKSLSTLLKQMEEDIEKVHKTILNYNDEQMKTPIKMEAIRNVTFVESPVKQNLVDKLMKKEPIVYYNLQVISWDDHDTYQLPYHFVLEVKNFMEEVGLGTKWNTLLPVTMEMSPTESLDKEEVEWLNLLPDPKWCLAAFNEVDELEKLAQRHSEEMHESITWLKEQWQDGYQVYIDFTEMQFIQIQ
jgi:hypothetical protein